MSDAVATLDTVTTLAEFTQVAHELWPLAGAENWDAPGLTAGDPFAQIRRVLIAVDAVDATVSEAIDGGFDLLLTHHPLILRGVTSVATDRYKGALLTRLIQSRCALLAAHTNADVVETGATHVLATLLSLQDVRPIVSADQRIGLGRFGRLTKPSTLGTLARHLSGILPSTAVGVKVAGDWEQPVSTVALCSGAGDSLLSNPLVQSADVYITSDLRHHPAQEAREQALVSGGPALIDISHWASEWLWCEAAADAVNSIFPNLDIVVSEIRTDPWDAVVLPAEERHA